jgi:hypothetical protein
MNKAVTINQFEGFGNDRQLRGDEAFRMVNMTRGLLGACADSYFNVASEDADYPDITMNVVTGLAWGKGIAVGSATGVDHYQFACDTNGHIFQSLQGVLEYDVVHRSQQNFYGKGLIVDPKGRLLYAQVRYLGIFDRSVGNYVTGTVSVTNGSAVVTGSGTTWTTAGIVANDVFRLTEKDIFYKVATVDSNTQITLTTAYSQTTASGKPYSINTAWNDTWKDFGADLGTKASRSGTVYIPTENYEDTVLIGRNNKIITLNTVTDTMTSDASPSFELPDGFDILSIMKGANGVLIVGEFNGKTNLVLWDNYSTRAIAPWIELDGYVSSTAKWNGGWIIMTGHEVHYTDGYSTRLLKRNFLDSSITSFDTTAYPKPSVVVEDVLYFGVSGIANSGKKRGGLHGLDLTTGLCRMFMKNDGVQTNLEFASMAYDSGYLVVGGAGFIGGVEKGSPTPISTFISNPVSVGENKKYAEGLRVPVSIGKAYSSNTSKLFSFTIVARISPVRKLFQRGIPTNNTSTEYNEVHVNGSTYSSPEVGDEVEFVNGANAGETRNITSIANAGTATETWTLDRVLPSYQPSGYNMVISPFQLVGIKTYTNITEIKDIYFNIKNRTKGTHFMIKLEIIDATVPVEIQPFEFLYSDSGIIE